jgi:protein gp37
MSDIFHPGADQYRGAIFRAMQDAPQHIYLLLTKRIERVKHLPSWETLWDLNVGLGVTVENQARADERVPHLLETGGASFRFVSVEPMLGRVEMRNQKNGMPYLGYSEGGVDWVICGAETGPGSRPMNPEWAYSLRDQCAEAGVPFFFKKWSGGREMEPGEMPREFPEVKEE